MIARFLFTRVLKFGLTIFKMYASIELVQMKDKRKYKERRNPLIERDILKVLLKKSPLCPTELAKRVAEFRHRTIHLATISTSLRFLKERNIVSFREGKFPQRIRYFLIKENEIKVYILMSLIEELRLPIFAPVKVIRDHDIFSSDEEVERTLIKEWITESRFLLKTLERSKSKKNEPLRYTWHLDLVGDSNLIAALKPFLDLGRCIPHEASVDAARLIQDNKQDLAVLPTCTIGDLIKTDPKALGNLCLLGVLAHGSTIYYVKRTGIEGRRDPIVCPKNTAYRMNFSKELSIIESLDPPRAENISNKELINKFINNGCNRIVTIPSSKVILDVISNPGMSKFRDFRIDARRTNRITKVFVARKSLVKQGYLSIKDIVKKSLSRARTEKASWRYQRALDYTTEKWPDIVDVYGKYLG